MSDASSAPVAGTVTGGIKPIDVGLLVLRLGIGIMFIFFGLQKVLGGPERWEELGQAMGTFGITFAPALWGLMASLAELVGGLLLLLGVFTREAALFLLITMVVAAAWLLSVGAGLQKAAHAIDMGIVFLAVLIAGPGRLSLSSLFGWKAWYA